MITNIKLNSSLIAPCGMNCGLCLAYQRTKNHCSGCNSIDLNKPKSCIKCAMKNCENHATSDSIFCFDCPKFPCARVKHIDKRYRTKYGMSMIENLNFIKSNGIEEFVKSEDAKWKCPDCGNIICVHRKNCFFCGRLRQ